MSASEEFLKSMLGLEEKKMATAEIIMEPVGTKAKEIDELIERDIEYKVKKDSALFQMADEEKAQTDILENQLRELQAQNEILQKSCTELEKANEKLSAEAAANRIEREESRKAVKKAHRLTVAAFVLSIIFPIASIVASVLIALYV